MSAIAAKFDLVFQALPYPTLREPPTGNGNPCGERDSFATAYLDETN